MPTISNRRQTDRADTLLKGVTQPVDLAARASLQLAGERVVITPHDEPDWLAGDECFVVSDITFDQLTGGKSWRQFSSTAELVRGLRNPSLDFGRMCGWPSTPASFSRCWT